MVRQILYIFGLLLVLAACVAFGAFNRQIERAQNQEDMRRVLAQTPTATPAPLPPVTPVIVDGKQCYILVLSEHGRAFGCED